MFNKNTQYISIIKSQQNIKINYQITQDSKIIKSEHSTFLLQDNEISTDAKLKLSSLNDKNTTSYISTLCENINQQIVTNDTEVSKNSTSIYFDTRHNIILDKTLINNDLDFYTKENTDYFLSPFTILQNIMNDKLQEKSLNLLIHNENIYAIVLDEDKRYSFSVIKKLPSYSELTNNDFFEDEISKQKLYEEMYLLQMQENISKIIQEFYDINKNTYFIENTNIFYSLKQLSDEQIDLLNKDLLLNINYKQVALDNYIFKLLAKPSITKQNFISVRKKPTSNKLMASLIVIFIISILFSGGIYWYKQQEKHKLLQEKIQKQELIKKLEKEKLKEISIPEHTEINKNYDKFISSIFDTIGSDSTLKEIKLLKDESTLVYNFIKENSYQINLKPALLKIYKNSENILTSKNNNFYTAIIANNNILKPIDTKKTKIYKPNKKYTSLSKKEIKVYLNKLLKESKVKFAKVSGSKYDSFEYIVTQNVKTPKSFFDNIDAINKQYYSIVLKFPIEFIKSNNTINIRYTLVFNQIKNNK